MKAAFLVSDDYRMPDEARNKLAQMGGKLGDGAVQLTNAQGRLFTLYSNLDPASEWEWREGPFDVRSEIDPPDMTVATACLLECRWEDYFVRVVRELAKGLTTPAWVLDGDGVLWPASMVDEKEIRL